MNIRVLGLNINIFESNVNVFEFNLRTFKLKIRVIESILTTFRFIFLSPKVTNIIAYGVGVLPKP